MQEFWIKSHCSWQRSIVKYIPGFMLKWYSQVNLDVCFTWVGFILRIRTLTPEYTEVILQHSRVEIGICFCAGNNCGSSLLAVLVMKPCRRWMLRTWAASAGSAGRFGLELESAVNPKVCALEGRVQCFTTLSSFRMSFGSQTSSCYCNVSWF